MTLPRIKSHKNTGLLLAISLLLLSLQGASAQDSGEWAATAQLQVRVPVISTEDDPSSRNFLEALTDRMAQNDSLTATRTSSSTVERSLSELKQFSEQAGIPIPPESANSMRIRYRFHATDSGFKETIESIQYLYQSPGLEGGEIPLLYIDGSKMWFQETLHSFILNPVPQIEISPKEYFDVIRFALLAETGELESISGKDATGVSYEKKKRFYHKVARLTFESM